MINKHQFDYKITKELIEKEKCPFCKEEHSMKESPRKGEYFCSNCGYVSDFPYIDDSLEYRQFAIEHGVKDKSRASNASDDIFEQPFSGIQNDGTPESKKKVRINLRIHNDEQIKKLKRHVRRIKYICGLLRLSKAISNRSCELYKEALDTKIVKHKKGEALNVACIFYACQALNYPKTMNEILQFAENLSKREMDKEMDAIKKLKSLENVHNYWENRLKQYCYLLNLSNEATEACYDIAKYIREYGFGEGQNPITKVATVIAFVCTCSPDLKDFRTLEEISEKVGPKKDTILTRMKELKMVPNIDKIPKFENFINKKSE